MVIWHSLHFGLWGKEVLLERHDQVYSRFLQSSYQRARQMGNEGVDGGKMSDPSGRSAPGEINSLLIWQQPHPLYIAEAEYQRNPTKRTLKKMRRSPHSDGGLHGVISLSNQSLDVLQLGP